MSGCFSYHVLQRRRISTPWHLDRIDLPPDGSFSLSETGSGVDIYILDIGWEKLPNTCTCMYMYIVHVHCTCIYYMYNKVIS